MQVSALLKRSIFTVPGITIPQHNLTSNGTLCALNVGIDAAKALD